MADYTTKSFAEFLFAIEWSLVLVSQISLSLDKTEAHIICQG